MKAQIIDFAQARHEHQSFEFMLKQAMDYAFAADIQPMYATLDRIMVSYPADWPFAHRKCQVILEAANQTIHATESTFEGF